MLASIRYIVTNPVRARLASSPEQWHWSSHRATLGLEPPGLLALDTLLQHFHSQDRSRARRRYGALIDQLAQLDPPTPTGVLLGNQPFLTANTRTLKRHPELPRQHTHPTRPSLEQIFNNQPRNHAIADAYRDHAYTMREIASHLNCHYATISRRLSAYEQTHPQPQT